MLYNILPIKEYFEPDGALMDAFMKSTIQSNNLRKAKNNHTRETLTILPSLGKAFWDKDVLHVEKGTWKCTPCLQSTMHEKATQDLTAGSTYLCLHFFTLISSEAV